MNTPDKIITGALRELADQAAPARPRIDAAWRASRRRRMTTIVTSAAGAAAIAVAVPLALTGGPAGTPSPTIPGSGLATVPSSHPAPTPSSHGVPVPTPPVTGPPRGLPEPVKFRQVTSVSRGPCRTGYPFDDAGMAECIHVAGPGMTLTRIAAAELLKTSSGSVYGFGVRMLPGDARKFGMLSKNVAGQHSPRNQLAVIVGGVVYFAPIVEQAVPGGVIQIVVHSAAQVHTLEHDFGLR